MAGSSYGKHFKITTWGESHGPAVGVVIDGVCAGLPLDKTDIQAFLDRRKPGQNQFTTHRQEGDRVQILSGVFEGLTTGTPISLMVENHDQRSHDYGNLKDVFRPGHADYTFAAKYGLRDYRGGGRSSGRETIGRVAAGAIAAKLLAELGITVTAYTKAIGPVRVARRDYDLAEARQNSLCMPNRAAYEQAAAYLTECMANKDSSGGIIECVVQNLPVGLGEPVFDKLDARLGQAILSIGAVKGFEIGDGFRAAESLGSHNNDAFGLSADQQIKKETNHSGGVLGGLSDGSSLLFRAAVKPTPSIARKQQSVDSHHQPTTLEIHGRHDPVVVPRAVVVVEAMTAVTLADLLLENMSAKLENIKKIYE